MLSIFFILFVCVMHSLTEPHITIGTNIYSILPALQDLIIAKIKGYFTV